MKSYLILDVSKTKVTGNYYYVNDVDAVMTGEYFEEAYYVLDGENCAQQATGPTLSSKTPPVFAPAQPINGTAAIDAHLTAFTVFGTYPNPFYDDVTIQVFLAENEALTFDCYDISGRLVFSREIPELTKGLNYIKLYLGPLQSGNYSLVIKGENHYSSKKLVKYR